MKKIILAVLAVLFLFTCTACDSWDKASGSSVPEDPMIGHYREILRCHKIFLISTFRSPTEDGLPLIRGTNTRPALADVLEENDKTSGELRGLLERFTKETDLEERFKLTDRIMQILVAADDIPDGDGLPVSEKKLAAIKAFWGEDADEDIVQPTTPEQAELIEQSYAYLVEHYCLSLICSMYNDHMYYLYEEEREDGSVYPDMDGFNVHMYFNTDELDEDAFYDICRALAYYGTLKYKSYEAYAEFRGYMESNVIQNTWWDEDDKRILFFPLIDKALAEINGVLDGVHDIDVIIGGDGDDELVGGDANELIAGGGGNDIIKGGAGNDQLQGGRGDDVYIFRPNCGDNVIFDEDGVNVLRFEGIPLENIYVSSVTDYGHEDDVRISFAGGRGSVTIRNFKDEWREHSFEIEVGVRRLAEDDPECPFMFIDDESRIPQGVMPPNGK